MEARGQTAAGIYSTGESALRAAEFARRARVASRDHGAVLHHRHGGGQLRLGQGQRLRLPAISIRSHWRDAAARKAAHSRAPRELPPGRYTVILEPAAVLDLAGQMFGDFSATAIRDGRSFLNDRIGQASSSARTSPSTTTCCHPLQAGAPFDGEGVPRRRLTLVERGVVREIAYCRQAAALAGAAPTGHGFPLPNEFGEAPANIVIAGGESSVEQMIASTERGILVTRLWYIREVDPYEKIFTGMTRDGTFLVEDGRGRPRACAISASTRA